MQYLIVHRLGVFVTTVPPRHIQQHVDSVLNQRGTGMGLSWPNMMNQILYRNHVADILEKDFVACTQGIEKMKQSLRTDVTMTQTPLICFQILYMLNDAVSYNLITLGIPDALSGFHVTGKTLFPKWRIAVDATSAAINIGCAVLECKIAQCCDSIIEELDREKNECHWTRTDFEQQLYDWAITKRSTLPKTLLKTGAGVIHNTMNLVGDSMDIAKVD